MTSLTGEMAESILPNGVRVLTERIPGVRSVSTGVWIRQGSAHETPELMGASHLLEHMVFKGTRRRSAREIALTLESLGGSLDAYTSREHTSFQARILDEHLPVALDVLADLVTEPLLRHEDLALEREVVLEEIATVEDTPDDLIFDLHGARLWGEHPYGHAILGTRETVGGMQAEVLREIQQTRYLGENLVVAAAGNLQHHEVVTQADTLFGSLPSARDVPSIPPIPDLHHGVHHEERASAQTHLVFGGGVPPHSDLRRFTLAVISSALGGGMSSRLFQRIREELGLAYSVFTFQSFYSRGGITGVYLGTRPATAVKAADAVRRELAELAVHGLTGEEVEQTKQQLKGQIMLSLESTGARLFRLARFALHEEPFMTLDEILKMLDEVNFQSVSEVAAEFFHPDGFLETSLGPAG
ncbi:MAG: M16 family metallopeptidase [Gemmatimonadota bacterium]